MYNPNNHACLIGTLDLAPAVTDEPDGSHVAGLSLACRDTFLDADGRPGVQHIPVSFPIPAGEDGVLSAIRAMVPGDLVRAEAYVVMAEAGACVQARVVADSVHAVKA